MRTAFFLAVSLTALGLSACGGGSAGSTPTPVSVTPTATATPTPASPTISKFECLEGVMSGPLDTAFTSGDVADVTSIDDLYEDILGTMSCQQTQFNDARTKLFDLNSDGSSKAESLTSVSWNPTHDAALLSPIFGQSEAILVSNSTWRSDGRIDDAPLAVIGQSGASRHMVLGGNPMRNHRRDAAALNEQMHQFLRNSLSWLTAREDLTRAPFKVVIAQTDQSYYFPDTLGTQEWLDANYVGQVTYNAADSCNGAALAECLDGSEDLLIISQRLYDGEIAEDIAKAVSDAMMAGTPVLYMHHDGDNRELAQALFPLLKVGYAGDNYWSRQGLELYNSSLEFGKLPKAVEDAQALITRFRDDSFTIDFSACEDKSCPEESGYQDQFLTTASALQSSMNALDGAGINLFKEEGRRYEKGLLLLADMYRQEATYPMDKIATPRLDILKSFYADRVVHVAREVNPAQGDMGNHSRSDFSHITPVTKSVTITARDRYKAAGVYALPGQTVTVTRTDSEAVNTHVKVNMIRSGATHEFDADKYLRPKYVTSQDLPIAAGETIKFTTPYGGPIQIRFDAKDVDVNFTFENVGEHAVWRGAEDNLSFAEKLDAGDYDWAELITPSFQVHSKLEKMRNTVSDPVWGTAAAVGGATEKYLHNYPHVLAGFQGIGIDVVPEIHEWAAANGLDIQTLDKVKHMNADQANCGYGCSGNPYDAFWSFNPIGHGDIHELGHGLERGRFRYAGQPVHTTTNPYSYYAKSKFLQETGDADNVNCQKLPYEAMFNTVQASRNEANPAQYMRDQNLIEWNQGAAINYQIFMAAQDLGILEDGRHLLARLHIIEREFGRADNNDTDWVAKRDGLGFGSFTRNEAQALSNNDWNLIALSHAMGRNLTEYLEMWGFELTEAAKTHVAAWNYPMLPLNYYIASETAQCTGFPTDKLPIDGARTWPVATTKTSTTVSKSKQTELASDHICTHDEH